MKCGRGSKREREREREEEEEREEGSLVSLAWTRGEKEMPVSSCTRLKRRERLEGKRPAREEERNKKDIDELSQKIQNE